MKNTSQPAFPSVRRAFWLCLILVLCGCSSSSEDRLAGLAPDVPERSTAVLLMGSDQELRDYYTDTGGGRIRLDFHEISRAAREGSQADRDFLFPVMERIGRIWEEEYDIPFGSYLTRYFISLDPQTIDRIDDLTNEWESLRTAASVADTAKIQRLKEMLVYLETVDHVALQVVILSAIAQLEAGLGKNDTAFDLFVEAVRLSESIGFVGMTCQNLGPLSTLARKRGREREAEEYLDRMSEIALRTRFAVHAARAESFRGDLAGRDGRLNAAYLHHKEARDLFKRLRGGGEEVHLIYNLVEFYTELECWEIVQGLLAEASAVSWGMIQTDDWIIAAYLKSSMVASWAGLGDLPGALKLAAEIAEEVPPRPFPQEYAAFRLQYAGLLLKADRFDDADRIIEDGIKRTVAAHLSREERSFRLLKVEVLEGQGRIEEALERLGNVATDLDDPEVIVSAEAREEAQLGLRLARAAWGDGPELAEAVVRMFRILQRRITANPPSAHTYLELQDFDEIRWLMHELIADDPALGYEFDMAWRGLTEVASRERGLGAGDRFDSATEAVKGWLATRRAGRVRNSFKNDDPHLVYMVTETEIIRWWRSAEKVDRTVLPLKPKAMRTAVSTALAEIASPPPYEAAPVGQRAQEALHLLARELVPADLANSWRGGEGGQQRAILWVSADDALTPIPFSTFDLASDEQYRPLAEHADTVYLRYLRTKDEAGMPIKTESVVVGDPVIAKDLKRKFSGLVPLSGAREEALEVSKVWGAATVLLGPDATKPAVLKHLEGAKRFYVAAHHERDQATPYIRFLPLAADSSFTDLSDAFVEAADILALDLRGCKEVVLAGCSSGAPYVDGSRVAPGFGDLFLDSGASVVYQYLWNIDDRGRSRLRIVRNQKSDGVESMQSGHPYYWGGLIDSTNRIRAEKRH